MANADELRISYEKEATYGTNPGGTLIDLRITDESLAQATAHAESAEIRNDRQVADRIRTNINVTGDINFELTYATFDDFLAAVLFTSDTWVAAVDLSCGDCDVVGATGTLTDGSAGASFTGALVGGWIKISGMAESENNGYFKILTVTSTDVIVVAGKAAMVDETAGVAVISMGAQLVNGVTQTSFVIEKEFSDLSSEFEINLGCVLASFGLSVAQDAVITGSFGVLGKVAASAAATGGGGYTAANTNNPFNGIDHVISILEGYPAVNVDNDFETFAFDLDLQNNLRERGIVGTLGPKSIGAGKIQVSGTLQAYFESKAIMDKYLNWTSSALAVVLEDDDGNAYVIDLPRVKFTDGKRVAGGENTDIIADMSYGAYMHETEGVTIRIVKFPAA